MRRFELICSVFAVAVLTAPGVAAAPAKDPPAKAKPATAKATTTKATTKPATKAKTVTKAKAVVKTPPAPEPVPVYASRSGILVPMEAVMKPLTPPESEANAVWNLRAGLNVAALQCQYSPFLATVKTYNDLLKDHSAELAAAQKTMMGHFKRYDGTRALNSFDQYTTRTYNSFSTLDAQYAFCLASSEVGRGALFVSKGNLGKYALQQTRILRLSLTPVDLAPSLRRIDDLPVSLPTLAS